MAITYSLSLLSSRLSKYRSASKLRSSSEYRNSNTPVKVAFDARIELRFDGNYALELADIQHIFLSNREDTVEYEKLGEAI